MRDTPSLVRYAYRLAGYGFRDQPSMFALAERLLGPRSCIAVSTSELPLGGRALLRPALEPRLRPGALPGGARWEIAYSRRAPVDEVENSLGHELGELLLKGERCENIENTASEVGWGLRAPDELVLEVLEEKEGDYHQAADALGLHDLAFVARASCACDAPTAIVGPRGVVYLGECSWPAEVEMHRIAHAGQLPDHVRRVPLRDPRRHVALIVSL